MKSRYSIYILTAAGMVALWFFAAFRMHYREYDETVSKIAEARQKLNDFEKTILQLPQFVKTRDELAKRKEIINSSLYSKENIISLFENFYMLADKHKVSIIEITPPIEELLKINRVAPDSSQLMFLNISLRVEGDYRDFGRFVASLEDQEFYRGPNHCNIMATYDRRIDTQYHLGFKSLLGSLKGGV